MCCSEKLVVVLMCWVDCGGERYLMMWLWWFWMITTIGRTTNSSKLRFRKNDNGSRMSLIILVIYEIYFCIYKVGGRSYNIYIYDGEMMIFYWRSRRWFRINIRAFALCYCCFLVVYWFFVFMFWNLYYCFLICDGICVWVCWVCWCFKARRLLST